MTNAAMIPQSNRNTVLVADDFAISAGVTSAIEQLARQRRISGTSAIVTLPRWPHDAARLAALRSDIAIGLHINLTLGAPLTAMPSLAPRGIFPRIDPLIALALTRRLDRDEIAAEIGRQIAAFKRGTGHLPDFLDGHQHVHALPVIRHATLDALRMNFPEASMKPLVRIPSDRIRALLNRGMSRGKAMTLASLSMGFSRLVRAAGFPVNDSFAGVTGFAEREEDVAADLAAAARSPGHLHLVMCHPGTPDAELAALDPVLQRRAAELAVLGRDNALTGTMWHPSRTTSGPTIDWHGVCEGRA